MLDRFAVFGDILATVLALAAASRAASMETSGRPLIRVVLRQSGADVRIAPAKAAKVVRHKPAAQPVVVIDSRGEWLRIVDGWIRCSDAIDANEGLAEFTKLIGAQPSAAAYACRARCYLELKRFDQARADAEHAIALEPGHAPAWYNRGSARASIGDLAGAHADFSKAIELRADYGAAYRNLGAVLLYMNRHFASADAYDRAIAEGEGDSATLGGRGVCRVCCGRVGEGISDLTEAIEMDPNNANLYVNRADAHLKLHRYDRALADADRALGVDCKLATAWVVRGAALGAVNRFDEALQAFDASIELDPALPDPYVARSVLENNRGNATVALADAYRALQLDPKCVKALTIRGSISARRGDRVAAINDFNAAISINENDSESIAARGLTFYLECEYDRAATDLEKAVKLHPQSATALGYRAWLLATCPDPQFRDGKEAIELAKRACDLTDYLDPRHIEELSAAYAEAGDFGAAIRQIEHAIAISGDDAAGEQRRRSQLREYREARPIRAGGRSLSITL